jgi:phosphorylcholine metabolism protein LicD
MKILALLLLSASAFAQILSFKDVKYEAVSKEDGKTKRADGMIHLDKDARVIGFSSDNRVLANIRYEDIESLTYTDDNKVLEVRYRSGQAGDQAKFKLDGGNRNDILSRMEIQTGKSIARAKK